MTVYLKVGLCVPWGMDKYPANTSLITHVACCLLFMNMHFVIHMWYGDVSHRHLIYLHASSTCLNWCHNLAVASVAVLKGTKAQVHSKYLFFSWIYRFGSTDTKNMYITIINSANVTVLKYNQIRRIQYKLFKLFPLNFFSYVENGQVNRRRQKECVSLVRFTYRFYKIMLCILNTLISALLQALADHTLLYSGEGYLMIRS